MKKKYFIPTAFIITTSALLSANWDGSTDGNWNTGDNWDTGTVPGSGEAAFIRINGDVFQKAQTRSVGRIGLGISDQTPTLTVGEFGGSITTGVGGTTQNNFGQNTSGTSTFNLIGGGLTASNFTQIGANTGNMDFNVSGGTLDLSLLHVGTFAGGTASFDIIGDGASLQAGATTFGSGGTLNFEFGADGVSRLDLDSLAAGGAILLVDLSSYTGPAGTFTIVDADRDNTNAGLSSAFTTTSVTEGAYAGSFITQDLVSDTITVTVIPEPGAYALLGGVLASSCVALRRRQGFIRR